MPSRLLLGGAVLLHLALVAYFAPAEVMLGDEPVTTVDYSLHFYQVDRAVKAFAQGGHLWGYDPQVLAGHPIGALEDLTSKGMELFVIFLSQLGVSTVLGFNLFILVSHLSVPLLAWLAALLFGLGRSERAVAVLLWILLWSFDYFVHWSWFCGMVSWAGASMLAVLLAALVYRTVERGPAWLWLLAAPLGAWTVVVHPFAAFAAAPACALIVLRRLRKLSWIHHAGVVLTIGLTVGINGIWIHTAMRFWHYVLDLVSFLKPPPWFFFYDYLDLLAEPWDTGGAPVRTVFRFVALIPAAVGLWRFRKAGDDRLWPLGLMIGSTLFLAYVGGVLGLTSQIQPYRLIVPAVFCAALPAAVVLRDICSPAQLRRLTPAGKVLVVLLLLLLMPRLARTVLVNMPEPLPQDHKRFPSQGPLDNRREALTGIFALPPGAMRHHSAGPVLHEVRDWLLKHHKGRGRILVQEWVLSEYLAANTHLPVLGGLEQRAIPMAASHLFMHHRDGDLPGDALKQYLERYAVGFVVVKSILPKLEWRKELLTFRALVGGMRVYETRITPSLLAHGQGRVVDASFNRIRVADAAGAQLVLRYHWLETLRCRPGCVVKKEPVKGSKAFFIRVDNPPKQFEIYNAY